VVRHYFGDERFDEVARELGVSKCSACRIHRAAQRTLARRLSWYEPESAGPA
jgi:DNA-directed RNA polymerase specialized sigma subunit